MATTTVSDTIYSDKTSTGWRLKISYTITQTDTNKTNNQSVVKQTLYVYNGTTGSYNNDGDAYYKLYDNTENNFKYSYGDSCDWHKLGERSDTITHDDSGSKTIYLSAKWCSAISTSKYTPYSITISSTPVSLPKIARASSITSASNVTLGSACSVKWTPASKSYYYKLKFVVGTKTYTTGALHPNTTSAYTYKDYIMTLDDYIAQMSSSSVKCNLTLYTYSDSACTTKVGTETTGSFTVSLPSSAKPTVGALHYTYSQDDSYSYQKQIFVQNHSKVRLYIDNVAQGFRGSTITKYIITGDLPNVSKIERQTYPSSSDPTKTDVFTTAGTKTFYIQVEDSRGVLSDKQSVSINVLPYSAPSIQIKSLNRSVDDNVIDISYSATYSSLNSKNNISSIEVYRKINGSTYSSTSYYTINNNFNGIIHVPNCSDTSSYYFKLKIKDQAYNSVSDYSNEVFINVASRLVNFGSQGNSVAFGKVSEKENALEVSENWNVYINGGLNVNNDITFDNGEQTGERQIVFASNPSNQDEKQHRCVLYGGNPHSGTGIGCWDFTGTNDRRIWSYSNITNTLYLANADANVKIKEQTLADFVIETKVNQATGSWSYRKWNSGAVEMWGKFTVKPTQQGVIGGVAYSNPVQISMPFGVQNMVISGTIGGAAQYISAYDWSYADKYVKIRFARPSAIDTGDNNVYLRIDGYWKAS